MDESYLAHYGVIGMKWGVRRYQNPDGTLTAEGKARARKEYKEDNKEAFEKGKNATIMSKAANYSKKALDRAEKRYNKNSTEKNSKRLEDARKVNNILNDEARKSLKEVKTHQASLRKKYGNDAISDIKYDKNGNISERTIAMKDIATSLALSVGSSGAAIALGAPVAFLFRPSSAYEKGIRVYSNVATQVAIERKQNEQKSKGGK